MAKRDTATATSAELMQQSEALRLKAEALKAQEIPEVVARMKVAIAHYGLTAQQLGLESGAVRSSKMVPASSAVLAKKTSVEKMPVAKAPAKKASVALFRDDAGHSWSGFGPRPRWLKEAIAGGASEDSLRVKQG